MKCSYQKNKRNQIKPLNLTLSLQGVQGTQELVKQHHSEVISKIQK